MSNIRERFHREWSIIWLLSQDTAGSYRDNVTALGWQCCRVLSLCFSSTNNVLMIGSVLAGTTKCYRVYQYGHLLALSSNGIVEYKGDYRLQPVIPARDLETLNRINTGMHTNTHIHSCSCKSHKSIGFLCVWPIEAKHGFSQIKRQPNWPLICYS